jgi:menaquinol-cytochrome c reductase iron-sulfur subunit
MSVTANDSSREPVEPERRSFLTRLSAVSLGTLVAVFPFAAGWGVVTSPVRRSADNDQSSAEGDGFVRICPLDSVPADGVPRAFVVVADAVDAWTRSVNQRIGEVFMSRSDTNGTPKVIAFTATCPHLGCAVEFDGAENRYECPCHESGFAKDGKKLFGPSLRGLDPLKVEIRGESDSREVWVRYKRFRAGIAERMPVA